MRKALTVLGAVTLIVIVVACAGFGVLAYNGRALDAESKAYVDRAMPAIVQSWDRQQLMAQATPELRATMSPDALNAFWSALSRYGPLLEYQGAQGDALLSLTVGSGSTVSARYVVRARFENGDATFRILLMKRDGRWMIHGFHVDSMPATRAAQRT